jgi:hypothetical protein
MHLRIVCMANSRKHGGRCVAGVVVDTGEWIRPVSPGPPGHDGTLSDDQSLLDDGTQPGLLDVIDIDVIRPQRACYQPENWIIGGQRWRLISRHRSPELISILRKSVESGSEILGCNRSRIQYSGTVSEPVRRSLALVAPRCVRWHIRTRSTGNRQIRAQFTLGRQAYDLPVTDLVWQARLSGLPAGRTYDSHHVELKRGDRLVLTVGLGEPYEGYCYKLVVGVLVVNEVWWSALRGEDEMTRYQAVHH